MGLLIHLVQGFPALPIGIICWWPLLAALTTFDTVLTSRFPLSGTGKKALKRLSNPSSHLALTVSWLLDMSTHVYI